MGGFFLVLTNPAQDRSAELTGLRGAFGALGFAAPKTVETPDYVFAAYPSIENKSVELKRYPNGDFVFVCGTCMRGRSIGVAAAAELSGCTGRPEDAHDAVIGHYAAVLRRNGRTEIKLDRFGGYHLFYNREAGIVSSSFYAICSVLGRLTLSQQGACEYVFNGVVSGNETLFGEVALAPIGATITVGPGGLQVARPKLKVTRGFTSAPRAESLDRSMALLDGYFTAVGHVFGDRVGCALSGGYDSRLILACLRRHGVRPRVYVYGSAAEGDVSLATKIARKEGFPLAVIDKGDRPMIPPEEFAATAHRNFLAHDGYGWGGIFQNDAEIAESARRVHGNAIALNGGGGEIFRNFFYLLDRDYTIRELLWSFYSQFDPAICTDAFDSGNYYSGLERKVMDLLGSEEERLPRPTVEWLYHSFRCRSWDGKVDSICGRYGFTAMPYLERATTEHASALRLSWKNHGAYEAELIRRADRRLAGYPSLYGHDFGGPPPLSRRLHDYATYLRPPWLRRYTYRLRYLRRQAGDWPGYLARAYRDAVLPGDTMQMRRLFHLDRIADSEQFARILSLEYALRHFGSRIKLEF
jgi:asparagine synthase (glutamine-hydrolysing)